MAIFEQSNHTSTYTGTETAADVNPSNAMSVTVKAKWAPISYSKTFTYTGAAQMWTIPYTGKYKIELWGASGEDWEGYSGGKGSYVSGDITLSQASTLYVYIGGKKQAFNSYSNTGFSPSYAGTYSGGASDIRLTSSNSWNAAISLNSRIIVAASGASAEKRGDGYGEGDGGNAGGLSGYPGNRVNYSKYGTTSWTVPTQSSIAKAVYGSYEICAHFGDAYTVRCDNHVNFGPHSIGGSGYYAGTSGAHGSGSGGSSYISGHTGAVAIKEGSVSEPRDVRISGCTTGTTNNNCSIHYSGYNFSDTLMIDGAGYKWTNTKGGFQQMPNPNGGYYASGVGHSGNGYARITYLGV